MADISKIIRKFERFMLDMDHNSNEPLDDRKSFSDIIEFPKKDLNLTEKPKVIGYFLYNFEKETETYIKIDNPDL